LKFAREGLPIVFVLGGATVVLNLLGGWWAGLAGLGLTLAAAGFFRDPERTIPEGEDLVVSPADGKVVAIAPRCAPEGLPEESFQRVSIFMSPFNVHVNRIPSSGEVVSVRHTPGRFLAAFSDRASVENERNALSLLYGAGRFLVFTQIAGWLARRIVCRLQPGERVVQGERFGLIMFGSRVDVYLPSSARLLVRVGDRVRAGADALGEIVS
jgi:phosphatidylserine decarboxylase